MKFKLILKFENIPFSLLKKDSIHFGIDIVLLNKYYLMNTDTRN